MRQSLFSMVVVLLLTACGGRAVDTAVDQPGTTAYCSGAVNKMDHLGRSLVIQGVSTTLANISTPPVAPGVTPHPQAMLETVVMTVTLNPQPLGPGDVRAEIMVLATKSEAVSSWWTPEGLDLSLRGEHQSTKITLTNANSNSSATAQFSTDSGLKLQGTLRAHEVPQVGGTDVRISLCLTCRHDTSGWFPLQVYAAPPGP